ncbi:MAG: beta-ketoacyl-ACP synthase III [Pseudomonadota bacterium]
MKNPVISGTGLYTPQESISNQELVEAFNQYVRLHNEQNRQAIDAGELEPLQESSVEFIEKASGIKSRFVMNKTGVLNPEVMAPRLRERSNEEPSILCEMAISASRQALETANKSASDVDAVIVACSNLQRPYPAIAVEVQDALGIDGYGYDMNVACSSATFGMQNAVDSVERGSTDCVLVINPEICSGHLNFRDRDSHFIFGDACTAIVIERKETCQSEDAFEILGTKLKTVFSNNIRNNFGFLNRTAPEHKDAQDKLFIQEGRKVFKEVVPMVASMIVEHLGSLDLNPKDLKRLWLHQANINMNHLISKKVLGRDVTEKEAPVILDEYANTSSAGSIIAFHKYHEDFETGDLGLICSFGAGYSAGSVVIKRC